MIFSPRLGRFFSNIWSIVLLLVVAVIVPTLCVLWLMVRASENEALALEQAINKSVALEAKYWSKRSSDIADSIKNSLLNAEMGIISEKEMLITAGWVFSDLGADDFVYDDNPEVAVYLDTIHYLKATLGPEAALGLIDDALESEAPRDWFYGGGRWFYPSLLMLAIDISQLEEGMDGSKYVELLYDWIIGSYDLHLNFPSERLFWISALEGSHITPESIQQLELIESWSRQWAQSDQRVEPSEHFQVFEDWIVFQFPTSERLWLKPITEFHSEIGHRLAEDSAFGEFEIQFLSPGDFVYSDATLETEDIASPLNGWRIALLQTGEAQSNTAGSEKVILYVWVGLLSVVLSVALSIAGIGLIRRKLTEAQLKNDLVATVSHELKTPVASIRMFAETLLHSKEPKSHQMQEYLQLIHNENERLGHLVEKFLSFSRIERRGGGFDIVEHSTEVFLEGIKQSFSERFDLSNDVFAIDANEGPECVILDAHAMETAIGNLLENAYRHTISPRTITLKCSLSESTVVFAVSDNGPGIPKEEQKKIFQKFYQPDRRLTKHKGGVGLGLSIVKLIVERHDGEVRLTSEVGKGSCFELILPYAKTIDSRR
jgi:signal transduction histidine kinase